MNGFMTYEKEKCIIDKGKAVAIAQKVLKGKPVPKDLTETEVAYLEKVIKEIAPKKEREYTAKEIKQYFKSTDAEAVTNFPKKTEMLNLAIEAENYMDLEAGLIPYISERLRKGYVGKEVYDKDGVKYIQASRGRPFGTVVAMKFESREDVVIGYSFLNEVDRKTELPRIGLYLALKRAHEGLMVGKVGFEPSPYLDADTIAQLKHFKKRAKAYFYPEKYSHSRGTDPVEYEDFDKIHAFQKLVAMQAKKEKAKKSK